MPGRSAAGFGLALLFLGSAPAAAQVRGAPLLFESTYGYANRLGIQVSHGGELDRISVVGEGSHHFGVGRHRRVSIAAAAGFWNPANQPLRFTGALSAQVRLDPAPGAGEIKRFTVRGVTGIALIGDAGRARLSVPLGIGAGYAWVFPVAHIEPWVVPHLVWNSSTSANTANSALPRDDSWKAAISFGVTVGAARFGGLRVAGD